MQCPFCKEEIMDGAIKCKHCGSALMIKGKTGGMEGWKAVVIAILLFFIIGILSELNRPIAGIIVIGSTLWACYDSSQHDFKNYKSKFMKASPVMLFFGGLLLWIAVFPWYLYFRSNVLAGNVETR